MHFTIIPEIRIGEIATIIALSVTLVYIIRYTKATVDLRDLEIAPFVYLLVKGDNFYIKNFGKFPALDIGISKFSLEVLKTKKIYELKFEKVNVLETNEEKRLIYKNFIDGKETDGDLFPHMHPEYQKEYDIPFVIAYKDVMGNKFKTNFTIGKSGIVIKSMGRA